MQRGVKLALVLGSLLIGMSQPLRAEVLPKLDDTALREAVALGQGPAERLTEFLHPYQKMLTLDASEPFASEIEVYTPFRLVVGRAAGDPEGYSLSQARDDYKPRDDRLGFQVTIRLPPRYVYDSATPFGDDWVIRARQRGKPLKFVDRYYKALSGGYGFDTTLVGAEIRMNYDIHEADLAAPVTVEIISPDGQRQVVEFNLADLR